ncbi:DUF1289 domain-containing protein [Sedimenticola thiotaurini]|uniref:DUF1289 domain-containing protein n=1 Tax=Sedimenticola thiotaurini TaxID=1543721 RepID=UPI0009E48FEC|nr:DUF1289 domain-containing protein [Sedimenticola thiotaurini]
MTQDKAPHSPCVRLCTLDDDDICIGCGRTLEEIKGWSSYDLATRTALLQLSRKRRALRAKSGLADQ